MKNSWNIWFYRFTIFRKNTKTKSDNPGQCNSVKKTPLGLANAHPSHSLMTYQILVILTWYLQKLDTQANTECKLRWNLFMSKQTAAKNPEPWDLKAKKNLFK